MVTQLRPKYIWAWMISLRFELSNILLNDFWINKAQSLGRVVWGSWTAEETVENKKWYWVNMYENNEIIEFILHMIRKIQHVLLNLTASWHQLIFDHLYFWMILSKMTSLISHYIFAMTYPRSSAGAGWNSMTSPGLLGEKSTIKIAISMVTTKQVGKWIVRVIRRRWPFYA